MCICSKIGIFMHIFYTIPVLSTLYCEHIIISFSINFVMFLFINHSPYIRNVLLFIIFYNSDE